MEFMNHNEPPTLGAEKAWVHVQWAFDSINGMRDICYEYDLDLWTIGHSISTSSDHDLHNSQLLCTTDTIPLSRPHFFGHSMMREKR